jgi:hypothetical protein
MSQIGVEVDSVQEFRDAQDNKHLRDTENHALNPRHDALGNQTRISSSRQRRPANSSRWIERCRSQRLSKS